MMMLPAGIIEWAMDYYVFSSHKILQGLRI